MADLKWAEARALELIAEHVPGTEFGWSGDRTAHGKTYFRQFAGLVVYSKIMLSRHATRVVSEAEVEDTILHEIAHVLAVEVDRGHGSHWQSIAKRLGANPSPEADEASDLRALTAPWVGTCPNGHESPYRYFRKPKRTMSCSKCQPTFNPDFLITYTRVK